jgi:hypothetical protein
VTVERRTPNVFDAGNAARRMHALADLALAGRIPLAEAAEQIGREADAWAEALAAGRLAGPDDVALGASGIARGLTIARAALRRRGPVVVRWIDPEGMMGLLIKGPGGGPPIGEA